MLILSITTVQDRLADLNAQAQKFVDEQHFDADNIQEKRDSIADRYAMYS